MKKVFKLFVSIILVGIASLTGISSVSALTLQEGAEAARCDGCPEDLFVVFRQVTNTILYIVGVIAVIMLIIGGIKYVISGGDSKKVTDAKNTVLYAIIGMTIAFFAYSIVNFVISALPSSEKRAEEETSLIQTTCS